MDTKSLHTDKLAHAGKPEIRDLVHEYQRSRQMGYTIGRISENDRVRYCWWEGQSADGKKHAAVNPNKTVFPFEGASDTRCRLADSTINEVSATLVTAWQRSTIRVGGTEIGDARDAALGSNLMRWITVNKLRNDLEREAELAAQYAQHYGWTVFHVTWDQQLSKRMQPITMDNVMAIAQASQGGALADLPSLIANPDGADQAAALIVASVPDLTLNDAKRMVSELRETGETKVEQDYVLRNLPCVTALRPYDEVSFPPETVDLQRARVIFRRQLMTEVEVRSMEKSDGWDREFIEKACTVMGRSGSTYESLAANLLPGMAASRNDNMIEIIWAYTRQINEDGIPAIYFTIFNPMVGDDIYAKHEMLDYAHGDYPFVEYRRETNRRNIIESRGIPEIASTDQDEIKAQHDSIRDSTAFETLPPIKVAKRIGSINKVAPGVSLPVTRPDDYEFMAPPSRPPTTAFNLIQSVQLKNARYFGLAHEGVPPTVTQTMMQLAVNKWLGAWQQIYKQMFALCLQYMAPEEIERVTGMPLPQNLTDVAGAFDFVVTFDVRELDNDFITAKLEAIAKFLVPLDTAGEIDRGALIRLLVESISPDAARELIVNNVSASERMYRQVQSDIGMMMLGLEAQYGENDPAAPTKLQYAEDVLRKNPKAQSQLQQDQNFQALFQNYVKSLQMSQMQQQNAQIGRIGVTPVSEQQQQQQPPQAPVAQPMPAQPDQPMMAQ